MKKLIWLLIFTAIIFSCCTNGSTSTNAILRGNTMLNKIDTIVDMSYADSMCMKENIPISMSAWIETPYVVSNGNRVTKYLYVSKMDSLQTIYTLVIDSVKNKDHFLKRITINKK